MCIYLYVVSRTSLLPRVACTGCRASEPGPEGQNGCAAQHDERVKPPPASGRIFNDFEWIFTVDSTWRTWNFSSLVSHHEDVPQRMDFEPPAGLHSDEGASGRRVRPATPDCPGGHGGFQGTSNLPLLSE